MHTEVIILAAGQGSRMRSQQPKVLHTLAGQPLVQQVLDRVSPLTRLPIHIIIGHQGELIKTALAHNTHNYILQKQQQGTGHAVAQALPYLKDNSCVLIAYGDVPLVSEATYRQLVTLVTPQQMGLLTVTLPDAQGYGRILRNAQGNVRAIVEQKDATPEQHAIREINTGIMAVPAQWLKRWLPALNNRNAQNEYYLTDIIAMAASDGITIATLSPEHPQQVQGVNDRIQLAQLERWYQRQQAQQLMLSGCTLLDPERLDIRGSVTTGTDVILDINVILEGNVHLGDHVTIGPNCLIKNAHIGDYSVIQANSVIENARIGTNNHIGPFARLRPGTQLADGVKIGNFVETKQVHIGTNSKVNHLSYLGDATLGSQVNVGAGTITCNYDGANKHHTHIEDGAFIGSNSALVAPVTIERDANIGAGSVITRNVPTKTLALTRSPQEHIERWTRPVKKQQDS